MTSDWNRNIEESLDAFYAAHEVLKKEIKEGPAFVREIYETLQRMGYLRLEARALMLDVRNEILDQNSGVLDPEEYERELHLLTKKPYDLYDVPLVQRFLRENRGRGSGSGRTCSGNPSGA